VTRVAWDAIWQRFHDQARVRMGPNAAVVWADAQMIKHRHGVRPVETQPKEQK
jgi:hypothetical protein